MPAKPKNNETTSPRVASKASDLLSDNKSSAKVKSVAGSDLTQAKDKPKKSGK